jgi:abortive infection bacteriophage resistance protein
MADLKPWKTMTEQLALLKSRGLQVDDETAALDYLARIGYYRLSGYWYPLREIDRAESAVQNKPIRTDNFISNSHFEDVVKLYVFDKRLRLLALDALERIEMAIRVDVAHLLGEQNACAHETPPACMVTLQKKPFPKGRIKAKQNTKCG